MKSYTVLYGDSDNEGRVYVAIKNGFSLPGLLIPILWTFQTGLKPYFWGFSILFALVFNVFKVLVATGGMTLALAQILFGGLVIVIQSLTGYFGNVWKLSGLKSQGLAEIGTLDAKNDMDAIRRVDDPSTDPDSRRMMI